MLINCEYVKGENHTIYVKKLNSVAECKNVLAQEIDVEPDRINFVYQGKLLINERTIDSYGVTDGTKIFYTLKPKIEKPLPAKKKEEEMPSIFDGITDNPLIQGMMKTFKENPDMAASALKGISGFKEDTNNVDMNYAFNDGETFSEVLDLFSKGNKRQAAKTMDNMLNMASAADPGMLHTINRYMNSFDTSDALDNLYGANNIKMVIPDNNLSAPAESPLPESPAPQPNFFMMQPQQQPAPPRINELPEFTSGLDKIRRGIRVLQSRGFVMNDSRKLFRNCEAEKRRRIVNSLPPYQKSNYLGNAQLLYSRGFLNLDDNIFALYANNNDIRMALQYLMDLERQ
ncbi:Ubiquitin family protein [Trichomonas vaginalis G3]|uniref:Ubiquitin family protein n=1 Tax=Trichomonas vaginalis (strain ATCC PRA-98 / G3) TaxID=412133 RepID=A2G1A3_TRIV3|nr:FI07626P-related family [Trichomonas vaginalis G3]EAX89061.1 Ubiquitin family protein [Trichomonas vaginalis G3]KAI5536918.1 FI07626P-related family [Trichomonas vaginalis G3]|eukprot:XP_001301991.1 Ubiquitin family protein [Trichomonas vaginalis G3]